MNVISLEFNFGDFSFVTLLQYTIKMFAWYLISWKQFILEIHKINPTQNLRLLRYICLCCHCNGCNTISSTDDLRSAELKIKGQSPKV